MELPDAEVLCPVRSIRKVEEIFSAETFNSNVTFSEGLNVAEILKFRPEIAIHLAALNTSRDDEGIIAPLIQSNITYGVEFLEILSRSDSLKLFINTGSFSQYTETGDAYLYSAAKSAFEVFLKFYSQRYCWKLITAVPYSVYGGKTTVKRVLDYIVESLGSSEPIGMTKGEQRLDFIHVDDIARFYIEAIRNYDSLQNKAVYHLGTREATSIYEVAAIIEKLTNRNCNITWGARPYRKDDIMYACAMNNISFWSAKIGLNEGLKTLLTQAVKF